MILATPKDWVEVTVPQFEKFLSECADYVRDGYCGSCVYSFRWNGKRFAHVTMDRQEKLERVWVLPGLLE